MKLSRLGGFEVRVPDGRPSRFFYFDDLPSRRLRPETLTREQAIEQARALARRSGIRAGKVDPSFS